jgi:hypothetical protein
MRLCHTAPLFRQPDAESEKCGYKTEHNRVEAIYCVWTIDEKGGCGLTCGEQPRAEENVDCAD